MLRRPESGFHRTYYDSHGSGMNHIDSGLFPEGILILRGFYGILLRIFCEFYPETPSALLPSLLLRVLFRYERPGNYSALLQQEHHLGKQYGLFRFFQMLEGEIPKFMEINRGQHVQAVHFQPDREILPEEGLKEC